MKTMQRFRGSTGEKSAPLKVKNMLFIYIVFCGKIHENDATYFSLLFSLSRDIFFNDLFTLTEHFFHRAPHFAPTFFSYGISRKPSPRCFRGAQFISFWEGLGACGTGCWGHVEPLWAACPGALMPRTPCIGSIEQFMAGHAITLR